MKFSEKHIYSEESSGARETNQQKRLRRSSRERWRDIRRRLWGSWKLREDWASAKRGCAGFNAKVTRNLTMQKLR